MHPYLHRAPLRGSRPDDPVDAARRVGGLVRVIAARDPGQLARCGEIARLAWGIAGQLDWDAGEAFLLQEAALLQDVGTLYSAGAGAPDEAHPLTGAMMTTGVLQPRQVDWIRSHHERWDGSGYPMGLRGDEISLGAALIGVADVWHDLGHRHAPGGRGRDLALAQCRALADVAFAEPAVTGLVRYVTGPGARAREPA